MLCLAMEADEMLRTMGLSPVTVPAVLHQNQVPDKATAKRLRRIERFLVSNRWVRIISPPSGQSIPGGWLLLQISALGYELVQRRESLEACIKAYQESLVGNTATYASRLPADESGSARAEEPDWWKKSKAETMGIVYDAEQEWPVFWAEYRIRRMWELFPDDDLFPVKWWEKKADYLFKNRKDVAIMLLLLFIVLVFLYGLYYFS